MGMFGPVVYAVFFAYYQEPDMHLQAAIPILRIFSVEKARDFYLDFLGFTWDWEHRFEAGFPLYAQVHRGDLVLHLSEHHGDATPGSAVFVRMRGVDDYHAEVSAKGYAYMRPCVQDQPWGRVMAVTDPFGNRLTFCESQD
ncbi:glyoxalase/bleomycin resistance protein/dioxygenase superfamily protein 23 [Achromobacter arsenitoxydans SY8]|uniref:Bleomycin resistance protein n=2 Tax=Achromobacter TaxID=222 RepID=H0FFT9_9BURK|nr:glyoxalase/bleomycin resistance protein/dioxygenase superfamily protein 23 [Achromobacter arsenitoxydans SY8]